MKKDINFLIERPIAHRGLHSEDIIENSFVAFSRAIDAGYPIELDVQITADGRLVVFHDWSLDRMTDNAGKLSDKKYDEIKDITLGESNQKILLFEDALSLINGEVALIVEIKSQSYFDYEICKKVYDSIKKYDGKYAISSFNPFIVKWFAKNVPEVVRGQNFTNFGNRSFMIAFVKKIFLYVSWIVSNNKPDFFAVRANTVPSSWPVKIARIRKKLLLTWNIQNRQEYDKISNAIDNEFFDIKPYEDKPKKIFAGN